MQKKVSYFGLATSLQDSIMNQPRTMRGAITRHTAEALNMTSPHAPAWARLEATKPKNPTNAIIAAIFGMDMRMLDSQLYVFDEQNNGAALS